MHECKEIVHWLQIILHGMLHNFDQFLHIWIIPYVWSVLNRWYCFSSTGIILVPITKIHIWNMQITYCENRTERERHANIYVPWFCCCHLFVLTGQNGKVTTLLKPKNWYNKPDTCILHDPKEIWQNFFMSLLFYVNPISKWSAILRAILPSKSKHD